MALRCSSSSPVMGVILSLYFFCADNLVVALVLSYSAFTWISVVLLSPVPGPAALFVRLLTNIEDIFPPFSFFRQARKGYLNAYGLMISLCRCMYRSVCS